MNDIGGELVNIVASLPGCLVRREAIEPGLHLREDLGLESIAMIDLIVEIENYFNIYLDPVSMDLEAAFQTVGSLTEFIRCIVDGSQ